MTLHDLLPFWPDRRTYYLPWVTLRTEAGERAEGPMLRPGVGRQEVLAWTTREGAERAALALTESAGGSFEIRELGRPAVLDVCKVYSSWGQRVVAVILS